MKNIVLIGFMGSGKTSVGKALAKKLDFKFVDLDDVIEKTVGMKLSEIFKKFGEPRFRDIESDVVNSVTKKTGQVIATGGGVVLRDENMTNLKKNGIIFCLKASEDVIFERLKHCDNRPLLMVEDPEERIRELLSKRETLYEKADFSVDTSGLTPEEVADRIIIEYERLIYGKT